MFIEKLPFSGSCVMLGVFSSLRSTFRKRVEGQLKNSGSSAGFLEARSRYVFHTLRDQPEDTDSSTPKP